MIDSIILAAGGALDGEFGAGYTVYREETLQGMESPCFFLSCGNAASELFRGKKYFRKHRLCIRYFPATELKREECWQAAERMFSCLEELELGGDRIRGTEMTAEFVEGHLDFFVNYNFFVSKKEEQQPMESVESQIEVIGQGKGLRRETEQN